MSKKRNDKESMICFMQKPNQKNSKIIGLPLSPPSIPDIYPFNYAFWDILENKTNATSHPHIGSLKTAIEKEWNKISEDFILRACKSF